MYHNGPSDNGIRTENFNNKHLLKEDLVQVWITYGGITTFVMSTDNGVRNDCISHARLNDKLRIPTYQAEIEPAIFIIHSQFITL